MTRVRPAVAGDEASWLRLRCALWPDGTAEEHGREIQLYFAGRATEPQAVLLVEDRAGRVVGMAELSIRSVAEGCQTNRVAYLEGWFVEPEARRCGLGRALLAAAEEWGRSQGCVEFGSDTEADNDVSAAAHRALGFTEVGVIRCFRKDLSVPNVGFRVATGADVAAMARCRAADAEGGPADPRMEAYFNGQHHPQHALHPRAGYIALNGDQVIGYIAGHRTTRHGCEGEVQYLFVAPAYRRRGVATALLRLLATWFSEHAARKVCVGVAHDTPPEARPFFESAGATPLKKHWYAWDDIGAVLR